MERSSSARSGGGFAGVYAAMYLDKTLARSRDVELVLISRGAGRVEVATTTKLIWSRL
jgi:NADH dehydrogenase FAD-containing subunit